jgi:sterol desaturase/sphingolipid hydroxylase (fatty acid hydroxylase superfamily)
VFEEPFSSIVKLNMASLWASTVASYNPHIIDIVGTQLIQVVFWWLPCTLYVLLDVIAPDFAARHKIQPAPKQPSSAEIKHAALVSLRNQGIVLALEVSLATFAVLADRPPAFQVNASLPTLKDFCQDFLICVLVREVLFYYAHRILHTRSLYTAIHKVHHRFTAPISFAAQYAHPIEHIVANTLPIALPPMLLRSHILTMWAFLACQLVETGTVHSGFDFFRGAARKHDRHHERFNVYFGGLGLLDWIHGTDEKKTAKVE